MTSPLPRIDPDRLRRRRAETGMLQSTVARLAGIDRTEYVRYETGTRSPRPPRAAAIAKVLGVPLAELLHD